MKNNRTAALIVAAGRGTRAGGGLAKQWRTVAGASSVEHCLRRFREHPEIGPIVLVTHPDDAERVARLQYAPDAAADGGSDRASSVRNGLDALKEFAPKSVLIHDVARPCVSDRLLSDIIAALQEVPAAAPALAVTDALWTGANDHVTGTQSRNGLFRAQTPQGFHYNVIRDAHAAHPGGAADDVEVARAAGVDITIVPGDEDNLKITLPGDFDRAARILESRMKIRLGNGFDVHAFEPGDHVILCGVEVPHDRALKGHSDADVAMHAVTDAIYGAMAQGDIGQHFPPSDPQWKGAASDIFLRHAVDLAAQSGLKIGNVDCTIICEAPKIGPHSMRMRETMARIMGLDKDQVSVKATTSERLGFTGRGEGIAAMATCTLVSA